MTLIPANDDKPWYPQNPDGEIEDHLLGELIPNMPRLQFLMLDGYEGRKIHSDSLVTLILMWTPCLQELDTGIQTRECRGNWPEIHALNPKKLRLLTLEDAPSCMDEEFEVQQYMRQILERMTSLEYLEVSHFGDSGGESNLLLKSKSLKTLDISGCGEEFNVVECSCPQLQMNFMIPMACLAEDILCVFLPPTYPTRFSLLQLGQQLCEGWRLEFLWNGHTRFMSHRIRRLE